MAQHRNLRGKINYISHQKGEPFEYGREWFTYTWHEDGQWTQRAICEIEPGPVRDRHVIRDVTYTLSKDRRPLDCFVRLHQDGAFLGTGWFRFTDKVAECEVFNTTMGRVSQRYELSEPPLSFGAHNLTCDVTHCARYDHNSGVKVQPAKQILMSSPEHDGCSGPLICEIEFGLEYIGRESTTVPAGTFETDHYVFRLNNHPDEHVWCLPDDFVYVKIEVGGYMNSTFELVSLEEDF